MREREKERERSDHYRKKKLLRSDADSAQTKKYKTDSSNVQNPTVLKLNRSIKKIRPSVREGGRTASLLNTLSFQR